MIESIIIAGAASYDGTPQRLDDLSLFNFVFGANGSGKTTICRVVADPRRFPSSSVAWKGGVAMEALVYNQDFVANNISQSAELKGVFTLGAREVDTERRIAKAKTELDALKQKVASLNANLDGGEDQVGKRAELTRCEEEFAEIFWEMKVKYYATFRAAMEGSVGSKPAFKKRVLDERTSNSSPLVSRTALEERATTLLGPMPGVEPRVPRVDAARLLAHETSPILRKKVVGKEDVDIAAMIQKLGNSDWVRQGRAFYDVNAGACPFCQQPTPAQFAQSLDEYFDDAYEADTRAINTLEADYSTDLQRVQQAVDALLSAPSRFLDVEKLKAETELLRSRAALNMQRIAEKKKESSRVVELESLRNVFDAVDRLIADANNRVDQHNKTVNNFAQEKQALVRQVWRFIVAELDTAPTNYTTKRQNIEKAIRGLEQALRKVEGERLAKEKELRELEKQATSIQPTVDAINRLLKTFGFRGFSIVKSGSGTSYRLVRPDGTDAKATLSEGERTFISFLYFYHLLKGSLTQSGIATDRVVVIDDPVSSLDADILFIVSTLIRSLFDEVRKETAPIKQVFVLTHNVYFHKEVTFNTRRNKNTCLSEETFWVVRKPHGVSEIERQDENPIKTSYDLLWEEVRRKGPKAPGIRNTLRRILEHYFKLLGGIDLHGLCEKFDGMDKLVCNTLISWVHDGSHFIQDDLDAPSDHVPEVYLRVFQEIFERHDHGPHYRMMMGAAYVELPGCVATNPPTSDEDLQPLEREAENTLPATRR